MARSRTIKPGFFTNDELAECSMAARLLYAGLWCIADREGRLEDRPKRIKSLVLPYDDVSIDDLLTELCGHKFICRYEADGVKCIAISKFKIHQTPHPKEAASELPGPCREKVCTSNGISIAQENASAEIGNSFSDNGLDKSRVISVASNVISVASKGTVRRGLKECKEEECKERECKEEENSHVAFPRIDPNFDERVDAIWPEVEKIHSEARPKIKPPSLNGHRKRAMSGVLDVHDRESILHAWRWAMTSPDFIAESIRNARGIDTFLQPDKIAGYVETAADPDRWKKQTRAGPAEPEDIVEKFLADKIEAEKREKKSK